MPSQKTWLLVLGLATLVWFIFFARVVLVPVRRPNVPFRAPDRRHVDG